MLLEPADKSAFPALFPSLQRCVCARADLGGLLNPVPLDLLGMRVMEGKVMLCDLPKLVPPPS